MTSPILVEKAIIFQKQGAPMDILSWAVPGVFDLNKDNPKTLNCNFLEKILQNLCI